MRNCAPVSFSALSAVAYFSEHKTSLVDVASVLSFCSLVIKYDGFLQLTHMSRPGCLIKLTSLWTDANFGLQYLSDIFHGAEG